MTAILQLDARSLSRELRQGRIQAEDVMIATLDRIDARNPQLRAIVSLRDRRQLLQEARDCDRQPTDARGKLSGIPLAVKDLSHVAGIPTTMGGAPWHRFPFVRAPTMSDPFVRRIVQEGAIVIGKTNSPEWGLGSHTFNPQWGTTLNPYDITKSAGGSSGGAAVALATGMLVLADGSDMMGSLRNPAGWNNVYSHRPTAGILKDDGESNHDKDILPYPISAVGPMAHNPQDLAFFLDIMAGPGVLDLTSVLQENPMVRGMKIGWLGDWGGAIPMEEGILPLCQAALNRLVDRGVIVESLDQTVFDRTQLWTSWTTIRSKTIADNFPLPPKPFWKAFLWLAPMKAELKWELTRGMELSPDQIHQAAEIAQQWSQKLQELFLEYDALALPTAQVWAFPAEWRYPQNIGTTPMETYHRWMEIVIPASLGGLPCTTIPAGFGENGLAMGIQLMGKRGEDAKLLNLAQAYHCTVDWPKIKPPPKLNAAS